MLSMDQSDRAIQRDVITAGRCGKSDSFDEAPITISGIIHNLVPVTLGNIVGGAGSVGAVYWAAFGTAHLGEK